MFGISKELLFYFGDSSTILVVFEQSYLGHQWVMLFGRHYLQNCHLSLKMWVYHLLKFCLLILPAERNPSILLHRYASFAWRLSSLPPHVFVFAQIKQSISFSTVATALSCACILEREQALREGTQSSLCPEWGCSFQSYGLEISVKHFEFFKGDMLVEVCGVKSAALLPLLSCLLRCFHLLGYL